jgi:hypothetical protein
MIYRSVWLSLATAGKRTYAVMHGERKLETMLRMADSAYDAGK